MAQGIRSDAEVGNFLKGLGFQGGEGPNPGFQFLSQSGNLGRYADFITGGTGAQIGTGQQGFRSNAEVGDWFKNQGYQGEFGGGNAFRWAYDQGKLGDYANFVKTAPTPPPSTTSPLNKTFADLFGTGDGLTGALDSLFKSWQQPSSFTFNVTAPQGSMTQPFRMPSVGSFGGASALPSSLTDLFGGGQQQSPFSQPSANPLRAGPFGRSSRSAFGGTTPDFIKQMI